MERILIRRHDRVAAIVRRTVAVLDRDGVAEVVGGRSTIHTQSNAEHEIILARPTAELVNVIRDHGVVRIWRLRPEEPVTPSS